MKAGKPSITATTGVQICTSMFSNLCTLLDRKGVLSLEEIGKALLNDAEDPDMTDRDDAAIAYIRNVGQAFIDEATKRDSEP